MLLLLPDSSFALLSGIVPVQLCPKAEKLHYDPGRPIVREGAYLKLDFLVAYVDRATGELDANSMLCVLFD